MTRPGLALALALLTSGCHRGPASLPCPPEAFVEAVHASAFHFQAGHRELGLAQLERARLAHPASPDPVSARLLSQLTALSQPSVPANQMLAEVEALRLEMGDWACLDAAAHQRFHQALPPLPGQAR